MPSGSIRSLQRSILPEDAAKCKGRVPSCRPSALNDDIAGSKPQIAAAGLPRPPHSRLPCRPRFSRSLRIGASIQATLFCLAFWCASKSTTNSRAQQEG